MSISDLISGGSENSQELVSLFAKTTKKEAPKYDNSHEEVLTDHTKENETTKIDPKKSKKRKSNNEVVEALISKKKTKKLNVIDDESPEVEKSSIRKHDRMAQVRHEDTKEKKVDVEMEKRTIFVGNLPTTSKKKQLKKLFADFGKVETVRFRCAGRPDLKTTKKVAVITGKFHDDRDNINAYVRFFKEEEALAACAHNGQVVEGHTIRVDMALDGKKHDQKKAIFLGNLHFSTKEDDVKKVFEKCGEILDVRLVRDSTTGIGKGFGYVNFATADAVELAVRLNKVEINGRQARVGRSVRKAKPGQPVGGKQKNKGKKIGQVKKTSQENPARKRIKNKTLGKKIKNGQPSKTEERSFQGTITDKSGRKIKPKIGKMEKKKKALAKKLA